LKVGFCSKALSTSLGRFVTHYVRTLLKPTGNFSPAQTHSNCSVHTQTYTCIFNVNPFSKDFPPTCYSLTPWKAIP